MHEWSALGAHELIEPEIGEDIPDILRASRDGPGAVTVGHPLTLRELHRVEGTEHGLEGNRCSTEGDHDRKGHPSPQVSAGPDWQTTGRCRRGR